MRRLYAILSLIAVMTYGMTATGQVPRNVEEPIRSISADTTAILKDLEMSKHMPMHKLDSALLLAQRALEKSQEISFDYGIALAAHNVGWIYGDRYEIATALRMYKVALLHCKTPRAFQQVGAYSLLNISRIYEGKGDNTTALRYAFLAEQCGILFSAGAAFLGHVNSQISTILYIIGQGKEALVYLNRAEAIALKEKDYVLQVEVLRQRGNIYFNITKDLKKAEHCWLQALRIIDLYKINTLQAMAIYTGLGAYYAIEGDKEKAAYFLNKAIAEAKEANIPESPSVYINLGGLSFSKKDYSTALDYYKRSLQQAERQHESDARVASLLGVSNTYYELRDYKPSRDYLARYIAMKDSVSGPRVNDNINRLQIQYQTAKKDKDILQNQLLIRDQEIALRKKNIWILGIAIVAILSIVLYQLKRRQQSLKEKQLQIGLLTAMVAGEEKERIRIARELHDGIVGQLLGVKMHLAALLASEKDNVSKTDLLITKESLELTTKDLRKIAHNLAADMLLHEGLAVIGTFCWEMARLTGQNIVYESFGKLERMDINVELSIYRMVQELVQNAIKHAQASQILVQLHFNEDALSITVDDDGIGFDTQTIELGEGMGLKSIQERVKMLNGKLEWERGDVKGTHIYLEFNITPVA